MYRKNRFQQELYNTRTSLRKRMEVLAKGHRGCETARGCGCSTDQALDVLDKAERDLFEIEITSFANTKDKPAARSPEGIEEEKLNP